MKPLTKEEIKILRDEVKFCQNIDKDTGWTTDLISRLLDTIDTITKGEE